MEDNKQNPSVTTLAETMPPAFLAAEKFFSMMTPQQLCEHESKISTERASLLQSEQRRKANNIAGRLAATLDKRYSYARASVKNYQVYHPLQHAVLAKFVEISTRLPKFVEDGGGLVFFGSVGTGKDHLLAAMLWQAARIGVSVHWINGQEVFGQFRDRMKDDRPEEELIRSLVDPDVLGISDPIPPAGQPTSFNTQQLYRILDRRNRAMKSTWVTINAVSEADADKKLTAPVFDRLRDGAEMFRCFWPSFRERKTAG